MPLFCVNTLHCAPDVTDSQTPEGSSLGAHERGDVLAVG